MAADSPMPEPRPPPGAGPEGGASQPAGDSIEGAAPERQFHGWRLLGFLMLVVVATAIVSAVVDFAVIPR